MKWLAKILLIQLASLVAPVVTLFYRKGIFLTPDDPVSPYGMYEPRMQWIYLNLGTFIGDWYWLGIRNTAFGLAYKFKPEFFKNLDTYDDLEKFRGHSGLTTYTEVAGYGEWVFDFKLFHIIAGYRMSPVYDTVGKVRPINMDARPILSIRTGRPD